MAVSQEVSPCSDSIEIKITLQPDYQKSLYELRGKPYPTSTPKYYTNSKHTLLDKCLHARLRFFQTGFFVFEKFCSETTPKVWQFWLFICISDERRNNHLPLQTRKGVRL